MAVSTISRITWTDDTGLGTDGSIINNSFLSTLQNNIDAMLSGSGSYTNLIFGGGIQIGATGVATTFPGAGGISRHGVNGLMIGGIAGSTYDLVLVNPSGASGIMGVPTGTINAVYFGAVSVAGLITSTGFGLHSFSTSGTGVNQINVRNSSAGTGNYARLGATSDTVNTYVETYSSTWTTATYQVQSGASLITDGSGGISIAGTHASAALRFYSGGTTERMRISSGGIVLINTTVTTSAAAGDMTLANGNWLRGVNAAGTDTKPIIRFSSANAVEIDLSSNNLVLTNAVTATTATTGASGAPPAQVVGYLQVSIAGTTRKIPYYAN